jgi:hypothetical protein
LIFVVTVTLLPLTHGFWTRCIVAYSYAASKVLILPVLYFWLILDDNKSLPWRDHPVARPGAAAVILSLVFFYMRSLHSINMHWVEMAFWGAFLSAGLALVNAVTRRLRHNS